MARLPLYIFTITNLKWREEHDAIYGFMAEHGQSTDWRTGTSADYEDDDDKFPLTIIGDEHLAALFRITFADLIVKHRVI